MKPLLKVYRMEGGTPRMIAMAMRPMQFALLRLGDLDNRYQADVEGGKAVWTKDGRRVEFWTTDDGGFGAARSREKDPSYPDGLEQIVGGDQ